MLGLGRKNGLFIRQRSIWKPFSLLFPENIKDCLQIFIKTFLIAPTKTHILKVVNILLMKRKTVSVEACWRSGQEEKCRLAININFLINIRCHAARVKAVQLEVEGYFLWEKEEKFLSWFIGDYETSAVYRLFLCVQKCWRWWWWNRLPTHILTFSVWIKKYRHQGIWNNAAQDEDQTIISIQTTIKSHFKKH